MLTRVKVNLDAESSFSFISQYFSCYVNQAQHSIFVSFHCTPLESGSLGYTFCAKVMHFENS